jgi:hypothetical protein
VKTPDAWPAERGFEAFQQAERQAQMTPNEHPRDGLEWLDLEMPRNMTLWGIIVACLGLTVLAFAWWPQ